MNTPNEKTFDELAAEYEALMHAMQSGVAIDHARGGADGTPKHLRVGVNSALNSNNAVLRVLLAKGICTREEYMQHLVDATREEVARYENILGAKLA